MGYDESDQSGLKLYARVFIMDDTILYLLRFIRGLIDSNDLPLNVSREILQDNKVTQSLRNACTKRVLTMLERLAKNDEDKYLSFWKKFGQVLKEDRLKTNNKEKVAALLRFALQRKNLKIRLWA